MHLSPRATIGIPEPLRHAVFVPPWHQLAPWRVETTPVIERYIDPTGGNVVAPLGYSHRRDTAPVGQARCRLEALTLN